MPEITSIEKQKKNPRRFSVFIDGKYAFGISEELFFQSGIRAGQTADENFIKDITERENRAQALDFALRLLAVREHSHKEIRDKLTRKKYPQGTIQEVIGYLDSKQYLDDEKFSLLWAEGRLNSRPCGKLLMRSELFKKGVEKDIIEKVVKEIYNQRPEIELARAVLRKKLKTMKDRTKEKEHTAVLSFLKSRGFSYDTIRKILNYDEF